MIILLIVAFILVAIFDFNTLLKGKNKKTLTLYFSLFLLGFGIHLLLILDKTPTSPAIVIEKIVKFLI